MFIAKAMLIGIVFVFFEKAFQVGSACDQPGTVMCIVARVLGVGGAGWSSVLPTWNGMMAYRAYISGVCSKLAT